MKHWNNCQIFKLCLAIVWMLIGSLVVAYPSDAIAKTYFVAASNGNDTKSGTLQDPFLTLERGVSVLSPGDTLYVRGGTYQRVHYRWEPPSGNSWNQPITIMAYQKEKVIIKPVSGYTVFEFKDNSQYIIMDGFIIDAKGGHDGLRMGQGSHHIRIMNGEVINAPRMGIQTGESTYLEFINLKIHDNNGAYNLTKENQSYGFYMPGSHILVKNCEIYRNAGHGVHMYSGNPNVKPDYNTFINNKVYDNDTTGFIITTGTGAKLINNVVWGNSFGIQVDYGATNTEIYNNTVYGNKTNEILLGPHGKDSAVANNILVGTSPSHVLMIAKESGNSIIEKNLIFGSNPIANFEAKASLSGNLIGKNYDPKLKDPGNRDFHLTEGSSAIGAGSVITEVETDADGVARNLARPFDLGAYLFRSSSLTPPIDLAITSYK